MAYLVLARKYRPQGFADLTGQEHVVQTLSNAMRSGRVAHALLFCGPRGCGKTTTARIVAKALNCERGPTPEPCDVCTPCREITAGSDVDVQEIDAASNTGVDNVRELRESAKYLPARDRYKIFIVDEVHMLSKAAFNAFLKTLEEPPGHVKFLFATTDPQALPDTILSRCQRHNFRLVPLKLIIERIQTIARAENVRIEDGAVALVARQAAGSMRDALSILDQLFSSCGGDAPITEADAAQALGALDRTVVSDLAGALLGRDARGILEGVARTYDGGHDLKRLAEDLATHLRNLIALSVSGAPLDLPDHEIRLLRDQAAKADGAELSRLFELVHGALGEMSEAAQPRHALEIALLRAVYLAPSDSVQGLLRRADELLRRMGGEPPPPSGGGGGGRPRATPSGAPPPAGGRWSPSASGPAAEARAPLETAPPRSAAPAALLVAEPVRAAPEPVRAPPAPPPEPARDAPPKPSPEPGRGGQPWERHLSLVPRPGGVEAPARPSPAPPSVSEEQPVAAAPRLPAPEPKAEAAQPQSALVSSWPGVVEAVRAHKKMLGSFLEHAQPLAFEGGELRLGFERGSPYAQSLERERGSLETLLAEPLGGPVRLLLVEVARGEGVATLAESHAKAEREARDGRLRGGREHPAVLRAARLLAAEVEDVRDLGGGTPS